MLIFMLQEATYLLSQTGQENIRNFIIECSLTVEAAGKEITSLCQRRLRYDIQCPLICYIESDWRLNGHYES